MLLNNCYFFWDVLSVADFAIRGLGKKTFIGIYPVENAIYPSGKGPF
jgi:hypothetical protein